MYVQSRSPSTCRVGRLETESIRVILPPVGVNAITDTTRP